MGQDRIDLARTPSFRIGPLTVEPALRQVTALSSETLQPRVMQVLVALAMADGAIVSRDDLVSQCWEGRIVSDDSINRIISRLRRLAEEQGDKSFRIETITKVGYRLIGTVALLEAATGRPQPRLAQPPSSVDAPVLPSMWRRRPIMLAAAMLAVLSIGVLWHVGNRIPAFPSLALSDFQTMGPGVPSATADAIDENILAAFSKDGQVTIARAKADFSGYLLGGTVERGDDSLRVSMRIENHATGTLLWSHLGKQPLSEADNVPTWVASKIGIVARCALGPARVYGRPLPDAVMAMVFAECDAENDEQWERALDIARRLTVTQPDFAGGWSARAWIASAQGTHKIADADKLRQEGRDALRHTLALDPDDSRAWETKMIEVSYRDLVAVEQGYQRALAARLSYCGCIFQEYASFLRGVGRAKDVRAMLGRTADVAPLSPRPFAGLAQMNAADGHVAEARANIAAFHAIMLNPKIDANVRISDSLWLKDYADGAALVRSTGAGIAPPLTNMILDGYAALQSGDANKRLAASRALGKASAACGCTSSFTVRMQAALGDAQGALDSIAATKDGHFETMLSTIGWDPILADARRLPGFTAVTERAGLLRYWRTTRKRPDFCDDAAPPAVCRMI